ncbi:3-methyl-2-oxobutanoate hydroxymethyltransferase [Rahnella victoriana]|uniref:3-methyl-2-oxobutanoate hydroxymethyltransferase n=1 Tax=Rahnella victoriana TaxID=1510570 RepID=A0ABS0DXZ3_9GAMM|nr:3-methyl-2-oxobutanoate hydroxymethyltransferase [Rahnella victoriana]MBF7958766.1 3-methyl-2-oxobutanoate hydroxymethyltransferase [Rahnella victoriana]
MASITLTYLKNLKQRGEKITMLTCYDATFAHELSTAGVEMLLIGDTLGMILQGHDSTLPVRLEDMIYHTACVKRGNNGGFIIADLSFMTCSSPEQALHSSTKLMQVGAQMVKIEGGEWLCDTVHQLTRNGIPVCAHIGLTPQSVNVFGGFKVQGRDIKQAGALIETAKKFEQAGAAMVLVEAVPASLGKALSEAISIPVIGIGAGPDTDGQVLVLHDMLGLSITGKAPKFVKNFMRGEENIQGAVKSYIAAVKGGSFPAQEHCYSE